MTSLLVIFRAFLYFFFVPSTLNLRKKFPVNQLIKKFWPKCSMDWAVWILQWTSYLGYFQKCVWFNILVGLMCQCTVKPVLSGHSNGRSNIGFQDRLLLYAGQMYCRKLHLSLRPLFCLFLSGRLRQVLLYSVIVGVSMDFKFRGVSVDWRATCISVDCVFKDVRQSVRLRGFQWVLCFGVFLWICGYGCFRGLGDTRCFNKNIYKC